MNLENVETFYPLSPAQQGILFHAVFDPASGEYFGQLCFTFLENFDSEAFERAWRRLVQRHALLRTFFVWQALKVPVQVVQRTIDFTIDRHDWRNRSVAEQQTHLQAFLKADRERGLDLRKAPLMRLTLIRLDEQSYRFIWSHHHLLTDGWSVPLIVNELLTLYSGYRRGEDVSLPDPRPYREYIQWLAKRDDKKAESYWRDLLKGFDAPTLLATAGRGEESQNGTPEAQPGDAGEQQIVVSSELVQSLQEVARTRHLTLNTIVQGAWAILLSRYTGEKDVVYGATGSGRPAELEGVEKMIGVFINTLPVRVFVNPGERVENLLGRIQAQQVETRQYEYSRLVEVQRCSGLSPGSTLFDNIVVFENYPSEESSNEADSSLKITDLTFHQKTNYPLTLAASVGGSLVLRILYHTRKFSSASIARYLEHMRNVLQAIGQLPDSRVGDIEILGQEEREQMLRKWNDTTASYEKVKNIAELFRGQAQRNEERIAVDSGNERLNYRELDERSNQLAHHLRGKGVGPERVVGLCTGRGVNAIVGLLAILKSGGAYLPLDPSHPQARLSYMLESSGAQVVVTEEKWADRLPSQGRELVLVDTQGSEIARLSKEPLVPHASSTNLAYVIFTSGSTGLPKGVMVEHRSLCNLVQSQVRAFDITLDSQVLQFASLSFDASVSEVFSALLSGATLHLASAEQLRPGPDLSTLLQERRITTVTLPPSILAVLDNKQLPNLKTVVSAGEPCSTGIVECWAPGRRFINAYGPTETTVCASMSDPLRGDQKPTIGKPITNGSIFILDSNLRPVPIGVAGELCVGGDVVSRGYVSSPDLTAERFVPDPYGAQAGARMYRTGDFARHTPEGDVEFVGRIDDQIKLRGFRIELGEIEALLEEHPRVSKAVVLLRTTADGDRRLAAYVTRLNELPIDVSELSASLQARVPDYMVPSTFFVMEAFPLTPNAKVDRQALPAPSRGRPETSETKTVPRTDAEQTVARIWCEVLELDRVGIHENFFDLGGHSLLMLQVHGKLEAAFRTKISMTQMFSRPTVSSLASYFSPEGTTPSPGSSIFERANRRRSAVDGQSARHAAVLASVQP